MGGVAIEGQKSPAVEDGIIWLAPRHGDSDVAGKYIGLTDGTRLDRSAGGGRDETDHRDHVGHEPCALVSFMRCFHDD